MVSDVSIGVFMDTSAAEASIADLDAKINTVAQRSVEVRNQVMSDVRQGLRVVSSMISGMHIATRILRLNLAPWQQALLSLVGTTVATMSNVAAAFSTTIVGIPAALIISAAALGLQVGVTIEIFAKMAEAQMRVDMIAGNTQTSQESIRSIISGLGGF